MIAFADQRFLVPASSLSVTRWVIQCSFDISSHSHCHSKGTHQLFPSCIAGGEFRWSNQDHNSTFLSESVRIEVSCGWGEFRTDRSGTDQVLWCSVSRFTNEWDDCPIRVVNKITNQSPLVYLISGACHNGGEGSWIHPSGQSLDNIERDVVSCFRVPTREE
jgi:hypothetical protein